MQELKLTGTNICKSGIKCGELIFTGIIIEVQEKANELVNMRYHLLATDYDGTLAKHEYVSSNVIELLKRFKTSGRKLILVTGRELEDLQKLFPEHILFDRIVAENGALIYRSSTLEERSLGELPPETFINKLKQRHVKPLSIGRVIISTLEPNETIVLDAKKLFK